MLSPLVWLVLAGPLTLVAVALAGVPGRNVSSERFAVGAAIANLVVAALTAATVVVLGTVRSDTLGFRGIGFSIYLDGLGAAVFCLVSFVGTIVVTYSRTYLEGDPRHAYFMRMLCVTLASILAVIVAGNLFQLVIAWIATSIALQQLLLFYPERPAAVLAGRKKLIVSRVGEIALIVAAVLFYRIFGSGDYTTIFIDAARLHGGGLPFSLHAASVLLAIAALLKSAQFPSHGWLTEVMETPTPVSALLHAGIINAGGFLILRLSKIVALSAPSLEIIAFIGGLTALFGSVVMLTQTSIKVSLAYSTVAQMGFMMLECGLGAFTAALLHLIAHSLYKAHAFLSSGSVVDIARTSWSPSPGGPPHPFRQAIAVVGVLVVALVVAHAFGISPVDQPGVFVLGAVVLLALVHLVASGIDERPSAYVMVRTLWFAVAVSVSYFALQAGMQRAFAASLGTAEALRGPFAVAVTSFIVVAFALVTFLQGLVPDEGGIPRWQRLYAWVSNGLYINTFANRLLVRYWPSRRSPTSQRAGFVS